MENTLLSLIAVAILGFGLVSGRLQNSVITPPMVFVTVGVVIGPLVFGWVELDIENPWIHLLAELTLVLVLFTDAARIDLRRLFREHNLPVRLLAVGMPLTLVAGLLAARALFPGMGVWEMLVLAAVLSPTDAALGQVVVTSSLVPVRIRQALNVESGLNDGIALPLVLVFLSCSGAAGDAEGGGYWLKFAAMQVTLGPLVGLAVGTVGGKLVERATKTGWMAGAFQRLSSLGLALLAFAGAEAVGGNGFIAAFCAGLAVGNFSREVCSCLYEFVEAEGQLLTLLIFLVFGVAMVPIALHHLDWTLVAYAALSLTVVRMLPVALALRGSGVRRETTLFLGWFGPRGIASILFALLVLEDMIAASEPILAVVVTTVLFSVFAHGLSAFPASRWYAARLRPHADAAEHETVEEMPLRLPNRS